MVRFVKGQRKDELSPVSGAFRAEEGILFIGKAQER